MRVVDPHIHLWDTRAVNYPWLAEPRVVFSGDNRLLPRHYDVTAFLEDASGIDVVRSVHIEANPADSIAEAQWLQLLAEKPESRGHPHGIVAFTDLSRIDAPKIFEVLAALRNVRGIRQTINLHADPRYNYASRDYLAEPVWRQNLKHLSRYGWSFDLQMYPTQAAAAADIVKSNPDIQFIINHGGMFVDRGSVRGWREWRDGLRTLASFDNASIKLSGLSMFDHRWTVESFRPLVLEAIDCFGAGRCMFASNFPLDGLHAPYARLWQSYAQIVSGASEREREALFVGNAIRYYRLPA